MHNEEKFLVAILFTDIEAFSKITHEDQNIGVKMAQVHHRTIQEKVNHFGGNCVNFYGDGSLTIFRSASKALECAIVIQNIFMRESKIPVRIGLHLGEVIQDEHSIYGDAVNIASRIEALSPSGGILMSDEFRKSLGSNSNYTFKNFGKKHLKNISTPITLYTVHQQLEQVCSSNAERFKVAKTSSFNKLYSTPKLALDTILSLLIFVFVLQVNLTNNELPQDRAIMCEILDAFSK